LGLPVVQQIALSMQIWFLKPNLGKLKRKPPDYGSKSHAPVFSRLGDAGAVPLR
jgi:hypothetical protein